MVAVGAGLDDSGTCVYHDEAMVGCIATSSFRFGLAADSGTTLGC